MTQWHVFFVFAGNATVKESYAIGPRKLTNYDNSVIQDK